MNQETNYCSPDNSGDGTTYQSSTKRIAKNTLMLYFRQILILLVSLYTVRAVLEALGAEDYGIYNVVAGVVTMFGFLSGAMATASQRYFSYELGRGNEEGLQKVFSVTMTIYVLLALVIVVLAETVGLWFVYNKLVIPAERVAAARWVYQFAILSFMVTLLTTPYIASIIAHENMNVYKALEQMKAQKISRALVCDEFGACVGIITLRDILEGLVGSMDDAGEEPDIIKRINKDGWLVDGQCPLYDFLCYFNRQDLLEDVDYHTVGGLILQHLQHIPQSGETLEWNNFVLEVVDMDGARIDKVLVTIPSTENEEECEF